MKKLLTMMIMMMMMSIFAVSCAVDDPAEEPEPSVEFTLNKIPATLPTENVWVITDTNAIGENFDTLYKLLKSPEAKGRKIKLEFPNIKEIPDYAFSNNDTNDSKYGVDTIVSVSAPNAVSIGEYAFDNCDALTDVDFPLATTIREGAFGRSAALINVSLPKAVSIGGYAFVRSSALINISLPKAESIGESAFEECDALTDASLPLAKTIGGYAFMGCAKLKTMTIATESTLVTLAENAFNKNSPESFKENIKVTTGSASANKGLLIAAGITDGNITVQP